MLRFKIIKALFAILQHFLNHKYAFPHKTVTVFLCRPIIKIGRMPSEYQSFECKLLVFSFFLTSFRKKKKIKYERFISIMHF